MSEQEQGVLVPVDVFNAITDYLSNRPYKEVSRYIEELRSSAKVVEMPQDPQEEEPTDD